ncbi:Sigma-fimbriae usher protein [Collimonas arenae]|uniref:Sigma-fimbriae usher protein n=1 Tax=Collimonas arenae TaxID=279058 RepID=A0A0A1FEV1_9BURK|nr:fimbria/pilus outer membrane usher protein [Collimonas arenae]AIY41362.1 Sigma-fimbriae usher protein [Collimonas arenae]
MVRRARNIFRWPTALAELILLQSLLVSGSYAADTATADQVAHTKLISVNSDSVVRLGGTDLYLEVTLNGADGGLVHFGYLNGELWASTETLRQIGFVLPANTPDPVRLGGMQGVEVNYEASRQAVTINAPLQILKLDTTVLNAPENNRPRATASPGVLLNYNIYGTGGQNGSSSVSAFTEIRAFNDSGVLSSTALSQATRSAGDHWQNRSVRLDTSWSTSFPDSRLTLRIGDTLTDALSWSRATRIAGVQLGTNFALQPYLITAPLPSFIGSATLPSNVQLYVNGIQQYNGKVPAGPFQLSTIPNISGAGNAQVVLTDTLGRSTTLNFSLYDEHRLLQKGLSDWSAEFGVVRENYGLESFGYSHDPTGSGTWRYGVSNNMTMEAHAEATRGLINAGGGGALLLGSAGGVVSGSLARSDHAGQSGTLYSLGYSWRNDRFNFSGSGIRTTGDYSDVATLYGPPPPSVSAQMAAGYSTKHLGNFSLSYIHLRYPLQDATRYVNANWSKSMGQSASLSLNLNQNLDKAAERSVFLVATFSMERNVTVSSSLQHDSTGTGLVLNASQSPPSEGGLSWRAALRQGDKQNGGQGELDYLGRYGQVQAGVNAVGNTRYGYAGADGALVLMGSDVFAARHINDGFAVISTDGVAKVPVKLENNLIGTTDSRGMLLVSPLNAYQNNQISIDPMDLPADVRIDRVKALATPTDRAGTLVHFGITPIRAASVILHGAEGEPLPLGSQVTINGQSSNGAIIGFDGTVYLDTLDEHNTLIVHMPAGDCRASFDYHNESKTIPAIGPLLCHKDALP